MNLHLAGLIFTRRGPPVGPAIAGSEPQSEPIYMRLCSLPGAMRKINYSSDSNKEMENRS